MNEKLNIDIKVIPKFDAQGDLTLEVSIDGKNYYGQKRVYRLVDLMFSTIKPMGNNSTKRSYVRGIRKAAEGLVGVCSIKEASMSVTTGATTDEDLPF